MINEMGGKFQAKKIIKFISAGTNNY